MLNMKCVWIYMYLCFIIKKLGKKNYLKNEMIINFFVILLQYYYFLDSVKKFVFYMIGQKFLEFFFIIYFFKYLMKNVGLEKVSVMLKEI